MISVDCLLQCELFLAHAKLLASLIADLGEVLYRSSRNFVAPRRGVEHNHMRHYASRYILYRLKALKRAKGVWKTRAARVYQ